MKSSTIRSSSASASCAALERIGSDVSAHAGGRRYAVRERSSALTTTSANELHRRAIIVDGHCDTPYRMLRRNVHLEEHDPEAQVDLKTLRESGITASFFAAYVPPFYAGRGAAKFAYRVIDLIQSETARYPEVLTF